MTDETAAPGGEREIVLAVSEMAAKAHKELYAFEDRRYRIDGSDLLPAVLSAGEDGAERLHLALDWESLLHVALWTAGNLAPFDVLALLKKAGVAEAELKPFLKAEISDLLPWLYYGNKFDILRRLCHAAKARAEAKVSKKGFHVHCHLVSDESSRIIASSL